MGAERDPAGQAGPGLTGMGGSQETGGMGDPAGTAEVHTGLHSGRGAGEEYSGLGFAEGGPAAGGVKERVLDTARTVRDRAGTLAGTARETAGNLGHRATELAGDARHRLSDMSERTNRALEERGFLGRLRENPLPALGIAFGVGFLLAGGGRSGPTDTRVGQMRRELRNALMAGLTAGAAQATRGFLQSAGGPEGIFSTLASRGGTEGQAGTAGSTRTGQRGRMSGGLGSSESEERPPSHRENL